MRTTEERLRAARARAKKLDRARKNRRITALCGGGSLAILAVLALLMPGITARFPAESYGGGMTASVFSRGSLGYLLVGVLAFALGVCVTLLCLRLRESVGDGENEDPRT